MSSNITQRTSKWVEVEQCPAISAWELHSSRKGGDRIGSRKITQRTSQWVEVEQCLEISFWELHTAQWVETEQCPEISPRELHSGGEIKQRPAISAWELHSGWRQNQVGLLLPSVALASRSRSRFSNKNPYPDYVPKVQI